MAPSIALLVAAPPGADGAAVLASAERFNAAGFPLVIASLDDGMPAMKSSARRVSWSDLGAPDLPMRSRPAYAALAFHRLGISDSVLVLGPGARVLRDITVADLIDAQGRPYVFRSEERDLRVDREQGEYSFAVRERWTLDASVTLGRTPGRRLAARGPAHLICSALASIEAEAVSRGRSLADFAAAVPDASIWHNAWLTHEIGVSREPIFRTLLTAGEVQDAQFLMESTEDFARAYLGVQLRPGATWSAPPPRQQQLAELVPRSTLLEAAGRSAYAKAPSLQRMVARLRGR